MPRYPALLQTVLDTEDARELAEFYRHLPRLAYRAGDEASAPTFRAAAQLDEDPWTLGRMLRANGRTVLAIRTPGQPSP